MLSFVTEFITQMVRKMLLNLSDSRYFRRVDSRICKCEIELVALCCKVTDLIVMLNSYVKQDFAVKKVMRKSMCSTATYYLQSAQATSQVL